MCLCKRAWSSYRVNLALPFPAHVLPIALIAVLVLGAPPGITPPDQRKDCAAAYRDYVNELARNKMSSERRAVLHQWALRALHACETGDLEEDINDLLERLERTIP
jgi:hypothetical protein